MTLDGKPWLIGGGVEHPVEVGRALAHMATMGSSGVGTPDSFKVTALPTPGTSVRVSAGIAAARNAYAGGANQSYVLQGASPTDVAVTPTGSTGGRSDLVVARVTDPQYEGTWPADPQAVDYASIEIIQGVPSNTISTRGLSLQFPCVALARIDLPASTATVTDAMITDLRRLVAPRQQREMFMTRPASGTLTLTSTSKVQWSSYAPEVFVPPWATRVQIIATVSSVLVTGSTSGFVDVRLGNLTSSDSDYDFEQPSGTATMRDQLLVVGGFTVPSQYRETVQSLRLFGSRASGKTGTLAMNRTQVAFDVQFSEAVL